MTSSTPPSPADTPAYGLVKAEDYATTRRWLVTVDGQPIGAVRRTLTARGVKQWAAWLGDTRLRLHRAPRSRQDAAVQVLMAYHVISSDPEPSTEVICGHHRHAHPTRRPEEDSS